MWDGLALACVAALVVAAGVVRFDTPPQTRSDVAAYALTVREMRAGEGYYRAHTEALRAVYGHAPSKVHAIRPPATFLVLRPFPEPAWNWIALAAVLASLLAAWRLARALDPRWAWASVTLVGVGALAFMRYEHLRPELFGLPFLLWGAVALRRGRDGPAAASLAAAVMFRELYLVAFAAALVIRHRRAPLLWAGAAAALVAYYVVHVVLAAGVLDPNGLQAPFGTRPRTPGGLLDLLGPQTRPGRWLFGLTWLLAGGYGILRLWRTDEVARVAEVTLLAMVPLTAYSTRPYWYVVWAPLAATFIPRSAKAR